MDKNRTFNTLFMLSSVDGKISTGDTNTRDFDKDLPKIKGLREGLSQYYNLEMKTNLHSFNTGKVMAKVGMNNKKKEIKKLSISFIIIDNKPYLTQLGVNNLLNKCQKLYLVTTNKNHPASKMNSNNLEIIYFKEKINFANLFSTLRKRYKIKKVTIQSGGTMNSTLIRANLIDRLSLVVVPALIGGTKTPNLINGASLRLDKDLKLVKPLKLTKCEVLKHSYLHLIYDL